MTKQNEIAIDRTIAEILSAVAERNTLDVLKEKTSIICKKYFPKADSVFITSITYFAVCAQELYHSKKIVYSEANRYKREEYKKTV